MKFGCANEDVQTYDAEGREFKSLNYWVLPEKKKVVWIKNCLAPDSQSVTEQTDRMKEYLTETLEPGTWMECNKRFYFANKNDWEMFKTMCIWMENK
jgi:hypothetical protein